MNDDYLAMRTISKPQDIHQRSQTSYTTQCNGVISNGSLGLKLGVWFLSTTHTIKNATLMGPYA